MVVYSALIVSLIYSTLLPLVKKIFLFENMIVKMAKKRMPHTCTQLQYRLQHLDAGCILIFLTFLQIIIKTE